MHSSDRRRWKNGGSPSVQVHDCCQRNRPHWTKHGACRRNSFRAASLSECAQTCPSDRKNHLAPFRDLQLLLLLLWRRHSYWDADRWCSTLGKCALRRAFRPTHLASSSATVHEWLSERRPCSTCLTCFRLFWSNLQMSFVTTHTSMLVYVSPSLDTFQGCETCCGGGFGKRCKSQGPCPKNSQLHSRRTLNF